MRTYKRFNNLGYLMRDAGLTQADLAWCCDVSQATVNNHIHWKSIPNVDIAMRYGRALGYSVYDLYAKPYVEVKRKFDDSSSIDRKVDKTYNNSIIFHMEERGYDLIRLATFCGIRERTMRRYVRDETVPNILDALAISYVLERSVYDLFETVWTDSDKS